MSNLDEVTPTFWRGTHTRIERCAEQIADAQGNIGNPWIVLSVLVTMERRKSITPLMALAGAKFHEDFSFSNHENLRAADMDRVSGARAVNLNTSVIEAKDRVWKALGSLGGLGSPLGTCAWHVLGLEETLKAWALREGWCNRPIGEKTAAGILIGALGVLVKHYG